ncbi:hypothetical protein LXA43DRAFT_1142398 [Ganoderma leucocontextum]|nr:hypothetical protein LXA43DRAFT_1142398 [Ganoderma leucocontextum]
MLLSTSEARERPERPSQPSSSTPRPSTACPSSPRRLHAPPIPSPNIIISKASPLHIEADPDDFSCRLKISSHSPRAAHARPAANGSSVPRNAGRPTPTPKSSGDWVFASSTSSLSYAQPTICPHFTLSSATDSSSASSALFDSSNPAGWRSEDSASSVNIFSRKLKKVYRTISGLESKLLGNDRDQERGDGGERTAQRGVPQALVLREMP